MSVIERLDNDSKDALRAGDKLRLGAIRRARAAIKNAQIDAGGELDEDGAVATLRRLVKQHRESIEQFQAGGRQDLVAKEEAELAVVQEYLPAELDEAQIAAVVDEVIAAEGLSDPADLGRAMKGAMARLRGQADGKIVRALAERRLRGES